VVVPNLLAATTAAPVFREPKDSPPDHPGPPFSMRPSTPPGPLFFTLPKEAPPPPPPPPPPPWFRRSQPPFRGIPVLAVFFRHALSTAPSQGSLTSFLVPFPAGGYYRGPWASDFRLTARAAFLSRVSPSPRLFSLNDRWLMSDSPFPRLESFSKCAVFRHPDVSSSPPLGECRPSFPSPSFWESLRPMLYWSSPPLLHFPFIRSIFSVPPLARRVAPCRGLTPPPPLDVRSLLLWGPSCSRGPLSPLLLD